MAEEKPSAVEMPSYKFIDLSDEAEKQQLAVLLGKQPVARRKTDKRYYLTFTDSQQEFKIRSSIVEERGEGEFKIKEKVIDLLMEYTDMDELLTSIVSPGARWAIVTELDRIGADLQGLKDIFTSEQYNINNKDYTTDIFFPIEDSHLTPPTSGYYSYLYKGDKILARCRSEDESLSDHNVHFPHPRDDAIYIERVDVHPDFKRRGYCTMLVTNTIRSLQKISPGRPLYIFNQADSYLAGCKCYIGSALNADSRVYMTDDDTDEEGCPPLEVTQAAWLADDNKEDTCNMMGQGEYSECTYDGVYVILDARAAVAGGGSGRGGGGSRRKYKKRKYSKRTKKRKKRRTKRRTKRKKSSYNNFK